MTAAAHRNTKVMRALGILQVEWRENRGGVGGGIAVWEITFRDREPLTVEVPVFGTTETSVLRKAVEMLPDRPVRYV
jgi:hypothetical protein